MFATVIGPRICEKYANWEPLTTIIIGLGWVLCYKVTYLYWRVSTKPAGSPKQNICHKKIKENDKISEDTFDPKLHLDREVI